MITPEQRARLLGTISAQWPLATPVELGLSSALCAEVLEALHPLLERLIRLQVTVVLEGPFDAARALALSKALKLRKLDALALQANNLEVQTLHTLCGLQTRALSLQIAKTPEPALRQDVEQALLELLRQSDAQRLDVAHPSVPSSLAVLLIGARACWSKVTARQDQEVSIFLLSSMGRLEIPHLCVHKPDTLLELKAPSLKALDGIKVHTLTVHGMLDLHTLSASMSALASKPLKHLHQIEACCMVREGTMPLQTRDILVAMGHTCALSHRPSLQVPSVLWGYRAITDTEAAWLTRTDSSAAPDPLSAGVADVSGALEFHRTVEDVLNYLASTGNKAIPIPPAAPCPPNVTQVLRSTRLQDKLGVLMFYKAPDAVLRRALSSMLKGLDQTRTKEDAQALMDEVVQALLDVRFPMLHREGPEDWLPVAQEVATRWISDSLPDAAPMRTTTTTTTTGTALLATANTSLAGTTSPIPAEDTGASGHLVTPETPTLLSLLEPIPNGPVDIVDVRAILDSPGPHRAPDTLGTLTALASVGALDARACQAILGADGTLAVLAHQSQRRAVYIQDKTATEAAQELTRQLTQRTLEKPKLGSQASADAFAHLLLRNGQWRLLRHFIPSRDAWKIQVNTLAIAGHLMAMAPWPKPTSRLELELSSNVTASADAIQIAAAFARGTAPQHLTLTVQTTATMNDACWHALADLASIGRGTHIAIVNIELTPTERISWLLEQLTSADLGALKLMNIFLVQDSTALKCLAAALGNTGVQALTLETCSHALALRLTTCKSWNYLALDATPALAKALAPDTLDTQSLSLRTGGVDRASTSDLNAIVQACKKPAELELWGSQIELADVASILDAKRSITTVRCEPSSESERATQSGLKLLRGNTSLQHFLAPNRPLQHKHGLAITPFVHAEIARITEKNRVLSEPHVLTGAQALSIGAVRGLNRTLMGSTLDDVGLVIAGSLDGKSGQSLSMVNKATFVESRRTWESHITQLAQRFAPEPIARDTTRPATASGQFDALSWVRARLQELREEGRSDALIAEVLGRRLYALLPPQDPTSPANAPPPSPQEIATIPYLLQAMASVRPIPTRLWLKAYMGIDV